MTTDEKYILRCLQLARHGREHVSPNPMVGAVIVRDGKIIGEGYHRQFGKAHAEVNAFESVKDKSLIAGSDMYVSLEPCSHFGKTPPCSQRIIKEKIRKVVISMVDPNPQVAGRGVKLLREAGIEVVLDVLKEEAYALNKEFITFQTKKRPYIYLKWAQTRDNLIDKERLPGEKAQPTHISTNFHKICVHKFRSDVMSIMVGTNTALNDNPFLTTRLWSGDNPTRITLDRSGKISPDSHLFNAEATTFIYTENPNKKNENPSTQYISIGFDENLLPNLLNDLYKRDINSVLVEGGRHLLQSFIDAGLWDEAFVEIADKTFGKGTAAPIIRGEIIKSEKENSSSIIHLKNIISTN